ncbi:MAG: M48 family metallopeptidase [Cellulosilyticaceae bacterium]
MKLSFEFNNQKVSYTIKYKKTHTVLIQVEPNGEVVVTAPVGAPVFSVMDKVKGHAAWIIAEIDRIKKKENMPEQYMYLGKNYGIDFQENKEAEGITVKLMRGKFVVEAAEKNERATYNALYEWYQDKTIAKAKERIKLYKEFFNKVPKKIEVEILKGKLSHTEEEKFILDANAAVLPLHAFDYVIVHALFKYNDMTAEFKEKIETILPEHVTSNEWINTNQDKFIFS